MDERTLREIYFPAFEAVVTRHQPWTVMCSYNRINGVHASQDPWLLTTVLREEWGFDGLVVSDWGAVVDRDRAVAAGLDLEMPSSGGSGAAAVRGALEAGTLSEAEIDVAAQRVLELVARSAHPSYTGDFDEAAHHALAREAAAESLVLLKNDRGALPLAPEGGPVAVIGEFARSPRFGGGGSSQVTPTRLDDAWSALQERLAGRELDFAPGFALSDEVDETELAVLREEAVQAAQGAATSLVFLGLPDAYESEGYDRDHMDLPAQQIALLEAVAKVSEQVIVVLTNGSPVEIASWQGHADAVLEAWLPGQAGGPALVDVLTGAVNPSGKLAETSPLLLEHNPAHGNFPGDGEVVRYGEGVLIGYRWYDSRALPVAYPFGHGLSYTSFAYSDLQVTVLDDGVEPSVRVRFTVTNTGERAGKEIAQVYVRDEDSSVFRPERELKSFAKLALEPGESKTAEIDLDARAFSYWHPRLRRWIAERGTFTLDVGPSSREIALSASVDLEGELVVLPLDPDSPASQWLAHPQAGPQLAEVIAGTRLETMLTRPESARMIAAIPIRRLSRFPGTPVTEEWLERVSAAVAGN